MITYLVLEIVGHSHGDRPWISRLCHRFFLRLTKILLLETNALLWKVCGHSFDCQKTCHCKAHGFRFAQLGRHPNVAFIRQVSWHSTVQAARPSS